MGLIYASFLAFTGLVAFITWRLAKGEDVSSKDGYFLAGRSLTFPFIAGSLLLTNLSTEQMVGLNGDAFIAVGKTRPLDPTKVVWPKSSAQARKADGGKVSSASRSSGSIAP